MSEQRAPKPSPSEDWWAVIVGIGLMGALKSLSTLAFTLAFVCIGLELSLGEFKRMGWRPVVVYLGATVFNTLLALVLASVIFGWLHL
jgi:uncharacterized membrane protein YadS